MVIPLIRELVREYLSKTGLTNQLLVYLLAFHVKYVTSRLHLEENSDSIRWTITAKQRKTKQVICLKNYPVMPSIFLKNKHY